MTKLILKKIGVLSLAKIYTILMAIVGLILGIFYAILEAVMPANPAGGVGQSAVTGLGVLNIIVMPIFYAVIGFISGVIGAWLYNLVAKWIGGLELEFEK